MAYLRRWHSSDPGVYTLAPFLLRVRETFERIANQPSVNGIACVRATGPFTAIPAARPFSSTSLSLSLSQKAPKSRRRHSIHTTTPGVHNYRNGNRYLRGGEAGM